MDGISGKQSRFHPCIEILCVFNLQLFAVGKKMSGDFSPHTCDLFLRGWFSSVRFGGFAGKFRKNLTPFTADFALGEFESPLHIHFRSRAAPQPVGLAGPSHDMLNFCE
jgi:hypothetical protein